jgi:hypothetical protein
MDGCEASEMRVPGALRHRSVDAEAPPTIGWRRGIITGLVVVLVVSPALRDQDSFPLSTYPVYASARASTATLSTAVGVDAEGTARRLSLQVIAQTDDPLIAESSVDVAISSGRAAALCAEISGRAPAWASTIEVVAERHDLVAAASGEDSLLERTVHATCAVPPP